MTNPETHVHPRLPARLPCLLLLAVLAVFFTLTTLTQKVVVSFDDKAALPVEGTDAVAPLAPKGGQPGSLAAETIQATSRIIAIDPDKHTTTLQFEDGTTQTFTRADLDPSRYKVGEQVVFRVTDMVAIWIEKP